MSPSYRPHLVVTVDTEEDDWRPSRDDVTVENIRRLPAFQELMDTLGVRPTYLVTYQVADVPWAAELLAELHDSGQAEVGAHLHPWNTPPLWEPMDTRHHLFANLDPELQRDKIASLLSRIREGLGVEPVSFRAGMWSLSSDAIGTLVEEGVRVDSSILPYVYWHDVPYSPSYSRAPARPYRLAPGKSLERDHPDGALLEVPATAGYTRGAWRLWGPVDRLLRTRPMTPFHVPGLLARTGVIERIALTPEITSLDKMLELTEVAARRRLPVLNVFLHSNSLLPGATQFAKSERERTRMLDRTKRYLAEVREKFDAEPATLRELADGDADT